MNSPERNTAAIGVIANSSSVSFAVVESALATHSRVIHFTNDPQKDLETFKNVYHNNLFSSQELNSKSIHEVDYIVFISSFVEPTLGLEQRIRLELQNLTLLKSQLTLKRRRTLIIFPYTQNQKEQEVFERFKKELSEFEGVGYLLVGDTFGPGSNVNNQYYMGDVLDRLVNNQSIGSPKNETNLYPLYSQLAGQKILHNLFSFGPHNSTSLAILGQQTSLSLFLNLLDKTFDYLKFEYVDSDINKIEQKADQIETITFDRIEKLKTTLDWLSGSTVNINVSEPELESKQPVSAAEDVSSGQKKMNESKKPKPQTQVSPKKPKIKLLDHSVFKKQSPKPKSNKFVYAAFFFVFILSLPFLTIISSAMSANASLGLVKSDHLNSARPVFKITNGLSKTSSALWQPLTNIPAVGGYFYAGYHLSNLLTDYSVIGLKAVDVYQATLSSVKIDGTQFSLSDSQSIKDLYLSVEGLYRELSFFRSEINSLSGNAREVIDEFGIASQLESINQKLLLAKNILYFSDDLFGYNGKKTYLVVFQNNMELRPTGGFIGSVGLASFQDGQMINFQVLDVYSIDGQLQGYVKPPEPIVDYLNEPTWYLRDSNWDPDFAVSAKRMMWFLDKSVGEKVDGVIAVDLEFARSILKFSGPVNLADHGVVVDENNFYETIQSEVEEKFFPGSRNKANILTSFSRQLLLNTSEIINKNPTQLISELNNLLEQKHILVYMDNNDVQNVFEQSRWTGRVLGDTSCGPNCYEDSISIVDANVGVNKANYYVKKQYLVSKSFEGGLLKTKVTVDFTNTGQSVLPEDTTYKSYLRLIAPSNANFEKVMIKTQGGISYKSTEIKNNQTTKEAGVYLQVRKGQKVSVTYEYSQNTLLDPNKPGEYQLSWIKQPGTYADPAVLRVIAPEGRKLTALPKPSLTQQSLVGYNSVLEKDLDFQFNW